MLRYFYLLVCIELCFCSDYIDHSVVDSLDKRIVRSKNARVHKKQTRSPKRNQLVEFDVANFMRAEEPAIYYDPNRYDAQSKRRAAEKYDDKLFEVTTDNFKRDKLTEFSHVDHMHESPRIAVKEGHGKHFNFQSLAFEDKVPPALDKKEGKLVHGHDKPTNSYYRKLNLLETGHGHPEAKCSYKNMKMPFFSSSKSLTSSKPTKKKRKMFCFNCHKRSYTRAEIEDLKPSSNHYSRLLDRKSYNRLNKRDYADMCPKCVKEMLVGLRKKNKKETTTIADAKLPVGKEVGSPKENEPLLIDKPKSLDKHLLGDFYYNFLPYIREKRSEVLEEEEQERERRLKELEEVEKRIDNVRITAPSFTTVAL